MNSFQMPLLQVNSVLNDRFKLGDWTILRNRLTCARQDALVSFDCQIREYSASRYTQIVFMCRVLQVQQSHQEESLRTIFNRAYHQVGQLEHGLTQCL